MAEAKARNIRLRARTNVDEDEIVSQETLSFRERVQERIDELTRLKDTTSNPGNQE